MRAIARVERFLERLVERPSARLFRARLQPDQILRRIERAMEAERGSEGRPGLVPDQFVVRLHPSELAALLPADQVAQELASGALSFARAHRYVLRDRPRVTLRPDPRLRTGDIDVDAAVSPESAPTADEQPDTGTRAYQVPVVRGPAAVLLIQEPGRPARRVPVSGTPMRIGRAPECELTLRDNRVSRRHARLAARNGVLVLADLDSTNGTRVNGNRINEVVLGQGDRIDVGDSRLVLEAAPVEAGSRP